jgi:zinc resistance-associated protein
MGDYLMKTSVLVVSAVLVTASALTPLVFGQQATVPQQVPVEQRGQLDRRPSVAEPAAVLEARVASLKAGLKLTPEQAMLWPPVEAAMREAAAKRETRMDVFRRDRRERPQQSVDAIERMRRYATVLTETGLELKIIADAAAPLYATLDDEQKNRLEVLALKPYTWFQTGKLTRR